MSGRVRRLLARGLALVFMLACMALFISGLAAGVQGAAQETSGTVPYSPAWTTESFRQVLARAGLTLADYLTVHLSISVLSALVFSGVGLLIFFRKRDDWFGLYIAVVFVLFGTISFGADSRYARSIPALAGLLTWLGPLAWWGLFQLLFLFPNGRFAPAWTRWIAHLLLLLYITSTVGYGGRTPPAPLIAAVLALFAIGAGSQVYRYRKTSTALERQQTKWVMFAMVVVFGILLVAASPLAFPEMLRPGSPLNLLAVFTSSLPSLVIPLIPLSFAFAILRYRLWEIDLVIRRTLQYGLLSLLLGLVYYGLVVVLGQLFQGVTGQQSPLVIVISTLAIAALANPMRRRIQQAIDRRFFRARYDADRAVAEFAMTTRSQVEMEAIAGRLGKAAQDSLQPEGVWLWIRTQPGNYRQSAPRTNGGRK